MDSTSTSIDSSILPSSVRRLLPTKAPSKGPARILVADDDPDTRWLVSTALRCDGHEVIEAPDGGRLLVQVAAAYAQPRSSPMCDLFVADIRMPVCSGIEILEAVRRARWNTPFIAMTAFADVTTRRRLAGLDALLFEKPFDIAELRTAVRTVLASSR
jgi:DNA-binding response OmpR family regulator